ncbi:hypothetical protein PPEP_a4572 [Pseudoalteromonas peptidolytica F12-50-A1]|uniref:Uncharacterized protein n=1 Tax=Pseudoalteromonas peptidolytica F12-50-A1 TaxID=1315280 RepID=A0A8I0T6C5_9GAMM|nr:hypothetical protein [Pseudoalteromonas peptidolytica F12-50-A1]
MRAFVIKLALDLGCLPSELKVKLTTQELAEIIAFRNLQLKASQPSNNKPRMTSDEACKWLNAIGAKQV